MKRILFLTTLATTCAGGIFAAPLVVASHAPNSNNVEIVAKDEGNPQWNLAPKAKYTKEMDNVFKLIAEGKYKKALEKMDKLAKESEENAAKNAKKGIVSPTIIEALNPLWDYALCLLEGTEFPAADRSVSALAPNYDPWGAYARFCKLLRNNVLLVETEAAVRQVDLGLAFANVRENFERPLLAATRSAGTEEAYDRLVDALYESPHYDDARTEREKIAYEAAKGTTDVAQAQHYLDKYGPVNAEHHAHITRLRDRLAYEAMPRTVEGCRDYLNRYPNSDYRSQVNNDLYDCAFQELAKTAAACRDYLGAYPESRHCSEVRNLLYEYAYVELHTTLEGCREYLAAYPESDYCERVKEDLEEHVYAVAKTQNTSVALAAYLDEFPEGKHVDEVRSLKVDADLRYYIRLEVPFGELEAYVNRPDHDKRVETFYNKLQKVPGFFRNSDLERCPSVCTIDKYDGNPFSNAADNYYWLSDKDTFFFYPVGLCSCHINNSIGREGWIVYIKSDYQYGVDDSTGNVYLSSISTYSSDFWPNDDFPKISANDITPRLTPGIRAGRFENNIDDESDIYDGYVNYNSKGVAVEGTADCEQECSAPFDYSPIALYKRYGDEAKLDELERDQYGWKKLGARKKGESSFFETYVRTIE